MRYDRFVYTVFIILFKGFSWSCLKHEVKNFWKLIKKIAFSITYKNRMQQPCNWLKFCYYIYIT